MKGLSELAAHHLPDLLLRQGPKGLLLWQVLALPAVWLIARLLGRIAGVVFRRLAQRATKLTTTRLDDEILERVNQPAILTLTVMFAYALTPLLELAPDAYQSVGRLYGVGMVLSLFWAAFRLVDVAQMALTSAGWFVRSPNNLGLVSLSMRFVKVLVAVLGTVAMLQELGYQVTGIIAGLGIGGLAVALAAQKTLEHVLGSIMLSLDQPFHVGDVIKFDDITGEVEAVGLRSTRVRTPERTLVTIPNGKLADMRIEAISSRDRIRLATLLTLQPQTSASQLDRIVNDVKGFLLTQPKLTPDSALVWVKELTQNAAIVEVICSYETTSFSEFASYREAVLLEALRIVERAGASWSTTTLLKTA